MVVQESLHGDKASWLVKVVHLFRIDTIFFHGGTDWLQNQYSHIYIHHKQEMTNIMSSYTTSLHPRFLATLKEIIQFLRGCLRNRYGGARGNLRTCHSVLEVPYQYRLTHLEKGIRGTYIMMLLLFQLFVGHMFLYRWFQQVQPGAQWCGHFKHSSAGEMPEVA